MLLNDDNFSKLSKDCQNSIYNVSSMIKCAYVAIVFAAMYLEAESYTYLSHYKTDSFAKKELYGLPTVCKWVYSIEIITGKLLLQQSLAYKSCDKLFKYRNEIVHNKSIKFEQDFDKLIRYVDNRDNNLKDAVLCSRIAVVEMARAVHKMHGGLYVPVLNVKID